MATRPCWRPSRSTSSRPRSRATGLLKQKEELYRKKAIPLIELEDRPIKDLWNRKQLVVAEKSLATVSAQYQAMREMAKHFGGVDVPT